MTDKRVFESIREDVFRGSRLPDWFRNTKTLAEVSKLLNKCIYAGFRDGDIYSAEAIERMVRARVIRFCQAGRKFELPQRDLQNWQEWFLKNSNEGKRRSNKQLQEHITEARKALMDTYDPVHISRWMGLHYPEFYVPKPATITRTLNRMNEKGVSI